MLLSHPTGDHVAHSSRQKQSHAHGDFLIHVCFQHVMLLSLTDEHMAHFSRQLPKRVHNAFLVCLFWRENISRMPLSWSEFLYLLFFLHSMMQCAVARSLIVGDQRLGSSATPRA
jgi:hypothetical protein